jgi:exodeoxyribonuclease V alpha subunit
MAPTGTAAKRIGGVIDTQATTIHIGLKWKGGHFLYNKNNNHPADIIMIDEASMIDMPLFYSLITAMKPDAKLILIGDIDQLPPVGPGKVLEDLLKSEVVPYVKLDRIYRQADGNPIADFAYEVNNGIIDFFKYTTREYRPNKKMNIVSRKSFNKNTNANYQENMTNEVVDIFYDFYKKQGFDIMDVQILAQMRQKKGGTDDINKRVQALINPNPFIEGTEFKIGDKVLQIRNNYVKEVMNGNIGKIIDYKNGKIIIEFIEGTATKKVEYDIKSSDINERVKGNIILGYAMTVNKSQGNEWKKVAILFNNYFYINRKVIYTGITRAREQAVVVTNYSILTHGIKTEFGIKEINGKLVKINRNTNLKNFLKAFFL